MSGTKVQDAKRKLRAKFSYAKQLDDTIYFGHDLTLVLIEYQTRINTGGKQPPLRVDGVLDAATQYSLGIAEPPPPQKTVLFSVNGTGAAWNSANYPYDLCRWQDQSRVIHQPIGYPAAAFPMGPSAGAGEEELVNQMRRHLDGNDQKFVLVGYSQGAMVTSRVLKRMLNGDLKQYLDRCIAGVTFGNPLREHGRFVGVHSPGGQGLDPEPIQGTPTWWYDYAAPGDIYAVGPGNDDHEAAEYMTSIYLAVQGHLLTGQDNLFQQVVELFLNPFGQAPAVMKAIASGLGFVFSNPPTAPHIEYHIRECIPGMTYFDHAMDYVRRVLIANQRIS